MEFLVRKTTEYTKEEMMEMNNLYNDVFKTNRTYDEMMNQYGQNPFGYSYLAIIKEDGKIVGANAGLPLYCVYHDKKEKVINNVDTFIQLHYRGIQNYYQLMKISYKKYIEDGFKLVFAFPNDDGNLVVTKSRLMQTIGNMYTYCLPYRIGGIKKRLSFLNWASMCCCKWWVALCSIFASSRVYEAKMRKEMISFNETRYKRMDGKYEVTDGFSYKILEYEGIRAAFLIDVYEKSPRNFCKAVNYILKQDGAKFDILLYPGYLPFANTGMIRIPHRYEPKHFHFVGKPLVKDIFSDDIMTIDNWDVNLSLYDLL